MLLPLKRFVRTSKVAHSFCNHHYCRLVQKRISFTGPIAHSYTKNKRASMITFMSSSIRLTWLNVLQSVVVLLMDAQRAKRASDALQRHEIIAPSLI